MDELPPAPSARSEDAVPDVPAPRRRSRAVAVLLALALTASVVEGGVLIRVVSDEGRSSEAAPIAPVVRTGGNGTDLSAVIARSMRSVVAVKVSSSQPGPFGGGLMQVEEQGSGVIIGSDLVVTNAHVVEGATKATVSFGDGAEVSATVLGTDATHDIAVLSAATGSRPILPVGSSGDLALGQQVVALGYPLGLGATATAGIVSGLDRTIDVSNRAGGSEHLEGVLQTDAAINPGNSGGPLIGAAGNLIGINTASASASAAENIGFAIAIDGALPIIQHLAGSTT
jgi:putative serine protease PepD